ncbi:MAG: hypothetical protein IKZ42_07105 [Clostridiales bacterium]|nr:hypothetical protein [Clostridiales bacterium]
MKNIRLRNLTRSAFATALVGVIAVTGFTACSNTPKQSATVPSTEVSITDFTKANEGISGCGSWSISKDTKVTDDLNLLCKKAMHRLVGADFTPVAYLGSQVVAGTNHCFLCKERIVYPGAAPQYSLVYIHENFNNESEIKNIDNIVLPGMSDSLPDGTKKLGGWKYTEEAEITPELASVIEKAAQSKLGAKYEPIANIGLQIVSGTNHAVICKVTPVSPDASSKYAMVYVYESLDGKCEITEVSELDLFAQL